MWFAQPNVTTSTDNECVQRLTAEYGDKLPKYTPNQTRWYYAKCLMLKHRS